MKLTQQWGDIRKVLKVFASFSPLINFALGPDKQGHAVQPLHVASDTCLVPWSSLCWSSLNIQAFTSHRVLVKVLPGGAGANVPPESLERGSREGGS